MNFGELSLDVPLIHKYTFDGLINPLINLKMISLKYIKWIPPSIKEEKKEDDDDDIDLDSSDSQFKLIALILNEFKKNDRSNQKLADILQ